MADDDDLKLGGPATGEEADDVTDDDGLLVEGVAAEPFVEAAEAGAEEGIAETEDEAPRRGRRAASGEPMNEQARRSLRARLENDIEAFLTKGGKIEAVPMDVRTDLPKKPESKYGSRSI